ncbi:MAG: phage terminase large subunit family protein, partial [Verrucomicrobiota bacterium]
MASKNLSPVERAAMAAWKEQDIRQPWEWAEDHVEVDNTSPMPGKWRSANSPWVKEFMEAAANKTIGFLAVKCSAQSSKTLTLLLLLLWLIVEDPGPSMYALANKDDAEDFVRDRFGPMLERCKPAHDLLTRQSK